MAITTNIPEAFPYRIGVDVGGTNTDAVIVDTTVRDRTRSIIGAQKSPTTQPSVTDGIEAAVLSVLQRSGIDRQRVASLAIGSTHFINAIAVIRLSKSFTREVPPFSDFPSELKEIMRGYCTQIDGGLQIDGSLETPVVKSQVLRECARIKDLGLKAVVVSGVFSPLDHHYHQEQTVRAIIERELPDVAVVCSSEISNIGFLERENASILNASIHHFAKRTIREFKTAMKRLGLQCGLYLTQNDGTLLDAATAARLPIRALSSGTTNSIRGAAYLCGLYDGKASPTSIVCDIGGTTTDVGVLLPSGYPRQALANVSIAGVKVNYGMPQVESIGIGGGSIIRSREGQVTVGRDSVGYEIRKRALVFGGDTMTATDVAVAKGVEAPIGDAALVRAIDRDTISETEQFIKREYERVCDLMKMAPEPLPLILVGGGSIICPQELDGISKIICPPHHDVANAVGAAMARISATVDIVQNTSSQTVPQAILKAASMAIEKVIRIGARPETVEITEQESLPLQYIDNQVRTIVKAVGDFSPSTIHAGDAEMDGEMSGEMDEDRTVGEKVAGPTKHNLEVPINVDQYRPLIVSDEQSGTKTWIVSPTDLEWMADGCYVLGCGGGGSPYPEMLKLQQHIQAGYELKIVDMSSLRKDASIYWAGNMGSPAVPAERLSASESILAVETMLEYDRQENFDALIGLEIGGSNGLQPLTIGSSRNFGRPVIDADWMGRAYPNLWQVIVAVQEPGQLLPCAIASGDGRTMIMTKSPDDKMIDQTLRAPAIEMGYYVGLCGKPTTTELVHKWAIKNTLSQAWRIGRCIAKAASNNTMGTVAEQIMDEVGGTGCAKVLFRGKIVDVSRRLSKGFSHGEVVIKHLESNDREGAVSEALPALATGGELRIPFMNENLLARHIDENSKETLVASVPDLITVLNAANGKALGIGDYKYGVVVNVLGLACSPVWNGNALGLEAGGPAAFGYDDVEYRPLGVYTVPRSVIEEFS
ncbi:hypothetical protein GE09DRAFT_1207648 [Coniochaeta sp. 2T2.1]|nr:hypothetical protein GE09DRAFT_1207648 [Coniochaeta sp. 2T2.1]